MTKHVFMQKSVHQIHEYLNSKQDLGILEDWHLDFEHVYKPPRYWILGIKKKFFEKVILPEFQRLFPIRKWEYDEQFQRADIYTAEIEDGT